MTFFQRFLRHDLRHLFIRSGSLHMWRILSVSLLFSLTLVLERDTLTPPQKSTYIYALIYVCLLVYTIMAHPQGGERKHNQLMSLYVYPHRFSVYLAGITAHWIFLAIHSLILWQLTAYAVGLPFKIDMTHLFLLLTSLNFVILRQLLSIILEEKTQFLVGFLIVPLSLPMLLLMISAYIKSTFNPFFAIGASAGICLISLGLSLIFYEFITRKF